MKLSLVLIIIGTAYTVSQAQDESLSEQMMANMTEILDLSDAQQGQMNELMAKYRGSIDWILAKYEGKEEPDVGAMIEELRAERDSYRKELQGFLSTNQYETYLSRITEVLTAMFNDLATQRLLQVQPQISLTDKQVIDLTPILGKSMMQTVQLLFENMSEKLSLSKKLKIKNNMKKIEKEKREGMENIMTPAQLGAYDEYKEAQKAARKDK